MQIQIRYFLNFLTQMILFYKQDLKITTQYCEIKHKVAFNELYRCSRSTWLFTTQTQRRGGAVSNHEAGVESSLVDQEGRQLAQGGVTQPFDPPLADRGQLMDGNGQKVQGLQERKGRWKRRTQSEINTMLWQTFLPSLGIHHGNSHRKWFHLFLQRPSNRRVE